MITTALQTIPDVANRLGIGCDAVNKLIHDGRLRAVNVGRGALRPRWRITEDAIADFISASATTAKPAAGRTPRAKPKDVIEFFTA